MNKTVKIVLIGIVIISVLAIFRDRSPEKIEFSEELADVPQPINLKITGTNKVDFANCSDEDNFSLTSSLGSEGLKVVDVDDEYCYVETNYEIEGSSFVNECRIPRTAGEVEFTGNNFEIISSFCEIKKEGGGMLDLKRGL